MNSVSCPVIMHYHLFPGGVSQLILNGLDALINKGLIVDGITIIIGTEERSGWFFERLAEIAPEGFSIRKIVVPELSYWSSGKTTVETATEVIFSAVKKVCKKGTLVWAHNPTLGKNPAYARAMKLLSILHHDVHMFMHVHDSAEQGRWPNLGLMRSELPETPYFCSSNVRWLTINRTDESFFLRAGMPRENIFYFPDIIFPRKRGGKYSRSEIAVALQNYADNNGFFFSDSLKWALFAGRTIRRKNVLESILIQLCADEMMLSLITLPSDSPDDKQYEDEVFRLLRKHKAGVGGFGASLVGRVFSLSDLAAEATIVQSASVMEGFGLPYLEFPSMGRPLFARRISTMRDFEYALNSIPHHYYDSFLVPIKKSDRDKFLARYLEKVSLLGKKFGVGEWKREAVCSFFESHFAAPAVDFSFLPFSAQVTFADEFDPLLRNEVRSINGDLLNALSLAVNDQNRAAEECSDSISSRFGREVYTENFKRIVSLSQNITVEDNNFAPNIFAQNLFESYFSPTNLRLLLDYKPYLSIMI